MFKSGQKIVCIKTSQSKRVFKDKIYTVREMTCEGRGVRLFEVESQYVYNGFNVHLFRPIDNTWVEELLCKLIEEVEVDELVSA